MSQITEGKILQTLAGERITSVSEIIEEVKEDICDNYCKYHDITDEEEFDKICSNCPLMRL